MSDEYLQVLYSETNSAKPKVPMPGIWLALYTVTPKDIHIDEHKSTNLAKVPDKQRLPMLAAIAKETHDLCRTGAFELVPLPSHVKPISSRTVLSKSSIPQMELTKSRRLA